MTAQTFTEAPIWQGTSLKPREGQRFFACHRSNVDRPGNHVEVVWIGTEHRQDGDHAILLTQTGERLVWHFDHVIYRSHRQMHTAETVTLPRELNDKQLNQACTVMLGSGTNQSAQSIIQAVWTAIKQHGDA
ncbi:hypothetical protein [Marinobacterium stanieri]|uniref:hypothetical protein n=1 Tax=Marinobacterium stanieri TaxID=49186 RepID=UPI000255A5D1|nr:hypothetical protein [Marinobacterium stanieri]